ncbi:hypothetical protein [uncultured Dokdonia sp.]|uniref:hypothetical protein n=1 Tax=uncultured Dokdonia sp. TaxID=575653 RepID=UPI002614AB0F|nr:hypothetical protein [uncultured Dokdonia sp.]
MIKCEILENEKILRLYPKYDSESGILEIQTKTPTDWVFGLDINGTIIFDINDKFIIENIDILIPKWKWEKYSGKLPWSEKVLKNKSVIFTKETINKKSFYINEGIQAFFDDKNLFFGFSSNSKYDILNKSKGIILSEDCYLLIQESYIVGVILAKDKIN